MKAFNVDTKKTEEINDKLVAGGTHILIGNEHAVMDYCKELRNTYILNHYHSDTAKIQSICWLKDGRLVVGFGSL